MRSVRRDIGLLARRGRSLAVGDPGAPRSKADQREDWRLSSNTNELNLRALRDLRPFSTLHQKQFHFFKSHR